ncbi:DNA polymerase III subunit beta [Mycoplasmopsis meleagridis]|uniref:DNA polymerase III subunit beta n=1 Tax=Mycoplasmopsis meleagridis TaxID=29561 RepID=UPI00073D56BE|nr:DNA polymerase III subunit beta [Mycoplasmopsis meleagridis]KUH47602.1 hypothetical protein ASB56_00490 [Mycoplasmopsis meleagridis]
MKIIVNKKKFEETIDIVSRYTDPINNSYGLRCILFNVSKEKITLSASNGFISIVKSLEVDNEKIKIIEEGDFLINSTIFKNAIRRMSKEITISDENGDIEISDSDVKYNLRPNNIEIFHSIDEIFSAEKIEINTEKFKKAIHSVIFATSDDDHVLKCINFLIKDNIIDITATDRYRLARYSLPTNAIFSSSKDISVLASSVKDLIPNDCPKKAILFFNSTKFGVEYDNTVIAANTSDVTFPNNNDYLFSMKEIKTTLIIKKEILVDLLNKAYVINAPGYKKISISINRNELKISVIVPELGDSLVKTKDYEFRSDEKNVQFDVDFNYFKEALSVFSGEVLLLLDEKPTKILILSKSNEECKQIVAPTRG